MRHFFHSFFYTLNTQLKRKMEKGKVINNVSATTAIDLKAELAKQIEQFEKVRSSTGKQAAARKPDKKPTVWSKQNKGVDSRNERDQRQQLEAVEGHTLTKSREQLEKKAKIYEALRSGKYRDDAYDQDEDKSPLIDFDRKYVQEVCKLNHFNI
jgi:asparagine synthetase B (glutamine-hydrolysing)